MATKMAVMVVWGHINANFCSVCFNWDVQRYVMSLSWAPSPTPTRNNRELRALSAVTAPKFETAMTTKMAVMVVWGHKNADFCSVCFN